MDMVGSSTRMRRALVCTAIGMLLAVPQADAQTADVAALMGAAMLPTLAGTPSIEGTSRTAEQRPGSPRDWPLMVAAEHSGRLALAQAQRPSPARVRLQRRGPAYRQAQRITAGVALGILGLFVGGTVGAGIGALNSEEAMLPGFAAGMWVGAAAGATIGVLLVK